MNLAFQHRAGLVRALLGASSGIGAAALLIALTGANALEALSAMWTGATGLQAGPATSPTQLTIGSGHLDLYLLARSLGAATPLLFCGLAVAVGLRAGLFNIGAKGQMAVGALAAAIAGLPTGIPPAVHIPLVLLAGTAAGGVWGALAGAMKAWRGVHEVIATIMLNFIAVNLTAYLVSHNLKDAASQNDQTAQMSSSACLAPLVTGSNLTIGLAIAVTVAFALSLFFTHTSAGFSVRAVGANAEAASAAGVSTPRVTFATLALSGAVAGLAGAVEAAGVHHRYAAGAEANYGFDGIAVALLGSGLGFGAILSALFFGMLAAGSAAMEMTVHVPSPAAVVVQGAIILFVAIKSLPLPPALAAFPQRRRRRPGSNDSDERSNMGDNGGAR